MSRIVVRGVPVREVRSSRFSIPSAIVGLAIGGGLALLFREVWGGLPADEWDPTVPVRRESSIPVIEAARHALEAEAELRDCGLELLPGGRGTIEMHGWVSQRRLRARAVRLVSDAIAPIELVNSVLVHGEDDGPEENLSATADLDAASA